ncbi:FHA domain-containing protein [Enhygromyxa salina]|uniref:FHA domain protein n=1 Tax=Enhygromyxa salina TaxID=215803 RepID=A0A2S9YKU9_9BACT|nr:FHA domain-containing protein [Enhygromyxa salina]PRQ05684.1 FHA domain protein [Enhygromyxa salina]
MRLIIEDLEGATTVVNLGTEEVTIGRRPHNTIQLTEQNVSRSHAKLIFQDEGWLIHDLGSYNGVKVNGVPINQPTQLRESDLIQIGDYHLTLTDNVDRQTVDIERPRAANDNYGAMSSSSDLPSMSVEDLGPMRSGAGFPPMAGQHDPGHQGHPGHPGHGHPQAGYAAQGYQQPPAEQEEKKNKAGLIIGIVGALAAVIGIGIFWASTTGDKGKDDKKEVAGDAGSKDTAGKTEPAANTDAGADSGPELVPEVADDAGAAAATDAGAEDDGGELVAETGAAEPDLELEPDPEPAPKPKTNNKPKQNNDKPKPPAEPKLPPGEALTAARKASMTGDNKKAYSLAKDAYDQNQSGDALNLMGVAACKMGSASKAKAAYAKMTSKDKATLEKICGPLGIEL